MKKVIFTFLFGTISTFCFSQDNETSLKKNIISADIGLFTAWLNYERHLGSLYTLKTELGFGFAFGQDLFSGGQYYEFTPIVRMEPRYYYNFNRRVEQGKKTSYNASNYFALSASYFLNPIIVSDVDYRLIQNEFWLMPKWGMKRTVGKKWNFELAFGGGVIYGNHKITAGVDLDLRFGYNIK